MYYKVLTGKQLRVHNLPVFEKNLQWLGNLAAQPWKNIRNLNTAACLIKFCQTKYMSANGEIIGLVLTGTIDPDTQEDLSWNRFHGKPQLYYNYDLLSVCCSRVYIVCNKFQKRRIFSYYPTLISRSGDHVSALPWIFLKLSLPADIRGILVLSTDFPRISFSDLTRLRRFCDQDHPVVLYNPHENRFEPGIGYYPIPVVRELICCYTVSTFQMQDFLNRSHVVRFMCESITSGEPVLKISSSPTKDQSQIISASASHDPGQCPSAE